MAWCVVWRFVRRCFALWTRIVVILWGCERLRRICDHLFLLLLIQLVSESRSTAILLALLTLPHEGVKGRVGSHVALSMAVHISHRGRRQDAINKGEVIAHQAVLSLAIDRPTIGVFWRLQLQLGIVFSSLRLVLCNTFILPFVFRTLESNYFSFAVCGTAWLCWFEHSYRIVVSCF